MVTITKIHYYWNRKSEAVNRNRPKSDGRGRMSANISPVNYKGRQERVWSPESHCIKHPNPARPVHGHIRPPRTKGGVPKGDQPPHTVLAGLCQIRGVHGCLRHSLNLVLECKVCSLPATKVQRYSSAGNTGKHLHYAFRNNTIWRHLSNIWLCSVIPTLEDHLFKFFPTTSAFLNGNISLFIQWFLL